MTLTKALAIYIAAILLHLIIFSLAPIAIFFTYPIAGFLMTRVVLRGLIEWHPNYNTLDNVVHAKMRMFMFWPIQMGSLLFKLMINKVM